jgi:hypothetical protein
LEEAGMAYLKIGYASYHLIPNFSSCLPSENVKIIILPVVLYGCPDIKGRTEVEGI